MKKIIHHLIKQPEEVRRHILHVSTIVLAMVLFTIWIYSLGMHLSSEETQAKIESDNEPLSAIKENFINGYESFELGE